MFRLNSLYDPDYTGTGHQPLGFDQWASVYDKYYVRRARIKVTELKDASTNVTPCGMFLGVRHKTTGYPSSVEEASENPDYSDMKICGSFNAASHPLSKPIIQDVDIKKFMKLGNLNDADVKCSVTTNPTHVVYGDINLVPINGNTGGTIPLLVEIEMDCVFSEPKTLAQS